MNLMNLMNFQLNKLISKLRTYFFAEVIHIIYIVFMEFFHLIAVFADGTYLGVGVFDMFQFDGGIHIGGMAGEGQIDHF